MLFKKVRTTKNTYSFKQNITVTADHYSVYNYNKTGP